MARPAKAWARRPTPKPFTAAEDEEIVRFTTAGLASEFWHVALPNRSTAEILNRRLELIEAGRCALAKII